ncbi:MAG TPA: reverse transcriptase domain-containing protein, partial [Aggregatilineales bacterium]|nr:reverse transcriptase domain-containing protein [Aggregatilineales bacterium]
AALPAHRLIRFADDFILLCADEDAGTWGLDVARRSLENLRLSLNLHKTRLTTFADGFTFLGYAFKHQQCYRIQKGEDT